MGNKQSKLPINCSLAMPTRRKLLNARAEDAVLLFSDVVARPK